MPEIQQEPDGHQKMALAIHNIFSQGQGVPVSSAHAERVVEMKLWLVAVASGQLKIVDTAKTGKPIGEKVPIFDEEPPKGEGNGTPPK